MKILFDTQVWLWWFLAPERINAKSREQIADPHHTLFLSAASSWEIAIKTALKKLKLPLPPKEYIPSRLTKQGMLSLPIDHRHALHVAELPNYHNDPFDRMLIAQAQIEKLSILTADAQFKKYKVDLLWAGE